MSLIQLIFHGISWRRIVRLESNDSFLGAFVLYRIWSLFLHLNLMQSLPIGFVYLVYLPTCGGKHTVHESYEL